MCFFFFTKLCSHFWSFTEMKSLFRKISTVFSKISTHFLTSQGEAGVFSFHCEKKPYIKRQLHIKSVKDGFAKLDIRKNQHEEYLEIWMMHARVFKAMK